ncbi:hypothetical protein HY627_00630 [Candidatus Uhrbacteria bacterium]|nr:hypothetical protein [Candidatus Uhrbacteria bacterium]
MKKQIIASIMTAVLLAGTVPALAANTQKNEPKKLSIHTWNFVGIVQSVDGSTITTKGKTLGKRTILTNASTEFLKGKKKISINDITKGSLIRIKGTWDKNEREITAQKVTLVRKGK